MTISFRTRLFVIAGLIVGSVLALVMGLGWSSVLAYEVERLDERLCLEARRLATQPVMGQDLPRLESDLLGKLHLSSPGQFMFRLEPSGGGPDFQTPNWHSGLAPDDALWASAKRSKLFGRPNGPADRPPPPRRDDDFRPGPRDRLPPPGTCVLTSFDVPGGQWRAALFTLPRGRSVLAADLAATKAELQGAVQQALKLVVPLAVALTALGAWLLSALTMRPVNRLRDAMKGVTQRALSQRLPAAGEDREFKELIDAFNTMLARLEASFQQASRFSADAAHELKTPLTILQGRIEQAINKSDQRAIQSDLTELLDEVGRLSAITRKLLLLSQADAGQLALQLAPIDLTALLDELASDAQMLLSGQTLHCAIEQQLALRGDAVLLRQLLNNLLSNAVRYCRPGGWIRLSAHAQAGCIEVVFSNATQVIAAADRARFFDRFFRGDASHNRNIDGNGLGLSLAREIARAHGGNLTLEASAPDEVKLRLALPPG